MVFSHDFSGVTEGAKVIHIRCLKSDPWINLLS
ncbi:chemotaxis protein [Escherichia coli]|uniref:Chemotaxis protein n=1 Tax=Citrobacter amalonaticus TaxID=35703 RepID=A0ABY0HYN2_CITAM|nr:chemotaxis protein [Salmonella enterica]EEY4045141.1 chemotaxis protein [Escherichia coli]EFN7273838.1 chemotaxis protein [Escherichia coli O7:H7]RYT45324.1 chemotaxis protein [Citrobacter amalonaticus]MGQ50505.1 chemotaxis protein [Escherichia coli]